MLRLLRHIPVIFLPLIIAAGALSAQDTDEQLAAQFYQNKEFDKAVIYYEKLYNKNPSGVFYNYFLTCLLETKDYKKSERLVKKLIKQQPEQLSYLVDLGTVYQTSGDVNKAKEQYEIALKKLGPLQEQVFDLARAFIAIKEWNYAAETYKRARKVSIDAYPYNMELAEVYSAMGDVTAMINEYLDLLELGNSYMQQVQNSLQVSFGADANPKKNEMLKTELLKRVQRSPDKSSYAELLIWMFIQQRDFEAAFIQVKALDKRKNEDGGRMMSLAQLCASNEAYETAVKSYQYVIDKGKDSYYYISARMELLNAMYKKIVSKNSYTGAELPELEKNYTSALTELGKQPAIAVMMKNLAHIQAFYLNKTTEAVAILQEAVNMPQASPSVQAECKLELADILLMQGEVWDASLTYSQVEKAFKHDPVGQEAKFRNARLSYYLGDFKWAQAQLDVLKASTSKLIANDALELSLVITDNMGTDSIAEPLLLFARADLLLFQNKDEEAVVKLDSIHQLYPSHALADDILYKRAQIALKKSKYEEAAKYYDEIIKNFSFDLLGDDALYKLAEMNETYFNNKEKALELYQELLMKFPGSLYVVDARKRFRKLRGDTVN